MNHIISNEPVHSSIFESINRNIKFGDVRISEIGKLIPGIFSKIWRNEEIDSSNSEERLGSDSTEWTNYPNFEFVELP